MSIGFGLSSIKWDGQCSITGVIIGGFEPEKNTASDCTIPANY